LGTVKRKECNRRFYGTSIQWVIIIILLISSYSINPTVVKRMYKSNNVGALPLAIEDY
jgi:hypothetical protein